MTKFAGMSSPTNVSFTGNDGKNHIISTGHPNNERIRVLMRETRAAFLAGDEAKGQTLWAELTTLADIPTSIAAASQGRVVVKDDEVYFNDEVLHNAITRRILWCIQESEDPTPYMKFLDNLMENPSKRAVDELFGFLEACNMGITDDGMVLAYKRVRDNYMDIHSGTMLNAVGATLTMPRNKVDEDKDRTCSEGLHFCSFSYLPHFGNSTGNKVVILELHPKNIVSIPSDYNDAKGRACEYTVVGEYTGADLADILSSKPVWRASDVRSNFGNDAYRRDEQTTLERFIEALEENDLRGDLDGADLTGDTTLADLPFSLRSQLGRIIEDDFEGYVDGDVLNDDDLTLDDLVGQFAEDENDGGDDDDGGDDGDEAEIDENENETEGSDDTLLPKVTRLLSEHLGVVESKITENSTIMADLGADSLDVVELVMAFEEEFNIEIPDAEMVHDYNVREVVAMLDARLNGSPVPVIDTAQTSAPASVTPSASGQTTVFVYPEQVGAETRWVAECPDCNGGSGWKATYARKRDARRGIKRSLGEAVAIVERDV